MEQISVNDYIRTKKGDIGKVVYISNIANRKSYAIEWNKTKTYFISQIKDIKHSPNIIDLIEVGDYVNGEEVIRENKLFVETSSNPYIKNENIKTIVTKEMMKNVMYEV